MSDAYEEGKAAALVAGKRLEEYAFEHLFNPYNLMDDKKALLQFMRGWNENYTDPNLWVTESDIDDWYGPFEGEEN